MRPALVSGASGFLGKSLVRRLLGDGRPVVALLRRASDGPDLDGAIMEIHDGTSADILRIAGKHRPETVFHLAALVRGEQSTPDEIEPLIRSNILFGTELAEACSKSGAVKFINAGTYFERRGGGEAYDPVSLYAATKKAFRDILEYYARATALRAATVSLYDTYGPGDKRPKLLNLLASHAATGEPLLLSPGEQIVDLVHADDVCAALLRAEAELGVADDRAAPEWCASSGERLSLRDLVDLFKEATGLNPMVRFGGRPYREREVMIPWLGTPVPGWKPGIPLKEGLRRVYGAAART